MLRTSADNLKDHIHGRLLSRSEGPAWKNVLVHLLSHSGREDGLIVPAVAEPLLVWIISGSAVIEEREFAGEWQAARADKGDFYLTNSATPYEMRWTSDSEEPFRVMHVYLGLPLIEAAAEEVLSISHDRLSLRDVSAGRDPLINHLLELILSELTEASQPSETFVQGAAQALAVHLVRCYADVEMPSQRRAALPAFKLRRVIDLMGKSIGEAFSLEALAAEVGLSPFHFSRVFKQSTGYSPSEYFIRMRMAEARRLLRETDRSVIEIGLDVGYSSPSHFATVFRKVVGVTPSEYRGG
ncbi:MULTISPECIES: AraC family transcriptional regulator [Rhizobium]|uniref:helix-turn-helix domain-containing protein n=1 Tax=Rhizobium TaxID=379 RepID=UPI0007E53024|nr:MULTISPECIES: AraC family transcriptional regulator [Rhizobium]TLX14310.1 helix-turn-helix domain-containing protein [Rhizobium sp. MHM7A]